MNIIQFKKLESTNTYAKLNIDNLADRTIISADIQTNGHGQFKRKWVDLGAENIYMTFVLKPSRVILNLFQDLTNGRYCPTVVGLANPTYNQNNLDPEKNSTKCINEYLKIYLYLTQYLAVCLCKQIEEMSPHPNPRPSRGEGVSIKLPNDVLINGKKVAGILAETVTRGNKSKGIVLGIGVNLNTSIENLSKIDSPATSLNLELGKKVNKQEFMQQLIERFFAGYDEVINCE